MKAAGFKVLNEIAEDRSAPYPDRVRAAQAMIELGYYDAEEETACDVEPEYEPGSAIFFCHRCFNCCRGGKPA